MIGFFCQISSCDILSKPKRTHAGGDLEEEFVFTMPNDKEFNAMCSALDSLNEGWAAVTSDESPLGAGAALWLVPPQDVDSSGRQSRDCSQHSAGRATTPVEQSPKSIFSKRVSLLAPSLKWSSWRARDVAPEGEIGRALLDMLGLWSTSGAKAYEVKVS